MDAPVLSPLVNPCPSVLGDRLAAPMPAVELSGGEPVQDLSAQAEDLGEGRYTLELVIDGARCGGCLSKIERTLSGLAGVETARMNLSTSRLKVVWAGSADMATQIGADVAALGYGVAPYAPDETHQARQTEQSALLRAMAVAGFALMNVMMLSVAVWSGGDDMAATTRTLLHWISALIALPVVAYAGQVFFRSAAAALRAGQANMDVPISLALLLACGLSVYETVMGHKDTYFDAALMLVFLLLIGRYLDARLKTQAGEAASKLAPLDAPQAQRIGADGRLTTVPSRDLKPGQTIRIAVGQRVPADCEIISGQTRIDAHIVTGESLPVEAGEGARLYSGSLNLDQPVDAVIISAARDSFVAEVRHLVEFGLQERSRHARLADRVARAYVPIVHTIALLTGLGWFWASGDLRTALLNAMAVLIITCPCALGLAIPAVHIVTTGRLFAKGIVVKSGDALERLAAVTHAVFDKTGTLTEGAPTWRNVDQFSADDRRAAASLASFSQHPLSRAIARATDARETLHDVREAAGQGMSGVRADGTPVRFGSADWVGVSGTGSWLQIGDAPAQALEFIDSVRGDAREAIARLGAMEVWVEMISGDSDAVTQTIAQSLGIEGAVGAHKPADKRAKLLQHRDAGRHTVMIGDGINDAPALASAHASMAMASASDVSRAAADLIVLGDKLDRVPESLRLARLARARIRENLTLAIVYNMLAIPLAIAGLVNPLIAAVAMSGSSLLVTGNALRMARA